MAAPIDVKICAICFGSIRGRSYRNLSSKTSLNQWGHIFSQLNVNLTGVMCNHCVNKCNRICQLTDESKTKVQKMLKEKNNIIDILKQMPGVRLKQLPALTNPNGKYLSRKDRIPLTVCFSTQQLLNNVAQILANAGLFAKCLH